MSIKQNWKTFGQSLALAAAVLLSSAISIAQAPGIDFSARWESTPLRKFSGPHGVVEGRIFERFVHHSKGSFSIGSVTYFKFPKPRSATPEDFSASIASEKIRKAMGFDSWVSRRQGKAEVREQIWKKMNRIVRIFMLEDKDSFTVSVAMFRISYGDSVSAEAELLQRALTGGLDEKSPWLERMITLMDRAAGIETAYAQAAPAPCPSCESGSPLSMMSCAACTQAATTKNVKTISDSFTDLNGNVVTTNRNATDIANRTNANAQRIGDEVNRNWAFTNTQLERANDILETALNPLSVFVTAASATAGALAVNMAVSLASEGTAALIEAITHAKEDAERLKAFEEARVKLEELQPMALKLEREIDSSLRIAQMSLAKGSREKLVVETAELTRSSKLLSESLGELQKKALANGMSPADACIRDLNREGARLDLLAEDTDKLLKALRKEDQNSICDRMKKDISTLIKAEDKIHKARLNILANKSVWKEAWERTYRQSETDAARAQRAPSENESRAIESAKKRYADSIRKLDALQELAVEKCMTESGSFWAGFRGIPILSVVSHGPRNDCRRQVESQYSAKREEYKRTFHAEKAQAQADLKESGLVDFQIQADPSSDLMAYAEYDKWLKSLRQDSMSENQKARMGKLGQKQIEIDQICFKQWDQQSLAR